MRATLPLLSFLALSACTPTETTGSTTGTVTTLQATSVSVDPSAFLGTVTCGNRPGQMQSYVATVIDHGPPPAVGGEAGPPFPITLPSSPPTSCSQPVYFEYVTVGNRYEAFVDGYEAAPSSLVPACGATPKANKCTADADCAVVDGCAGRCEITSVKVKGLEQSGFGFKPCDTPDSALPKDAVKTCGCQYPVSEGDRHMYGRKSGELVTPRWTTPATQPCGSFAPAIALDFANTVIDGCGPLEDTGTSIATGIEVDPHATLAGTTLACTTDATPGTISSFDVTPKDGTIMPIAGIACGQKGGVTFSMGVTDATEYVFVVDAYENGGGTPTKTSTCRAIAAAGVTVLATCDPLVQKP